MWDLLREQSYGGGPVMYCSGLLYFMLGRLFVNLQWIH